MKILDKLIGGGKVTFQVSLEEEVNEGDIITVEGQEYEVASVEIFSTLMDPPRPHSKMVRVK